MRLPFITRPRTSARSRWSAWVLAAVSVLPGAAYAVDTPVAGKELRRTTATTVYERARAAVVNIQSERLASANTPGPDLLALAPSQNRINGMGTGIVIDPRGYILTNHHVVDDVALLKVRLHDGTSYTAKVLARDPEADLAMLKIDAASPLPTVPFGTSSDLMVGETVIAIGNAYGYEHSMTLGIVSAIKRDVTLNKELSYKALIQTDASINPGNSGGPLLNIHGELVGVNVAIRAGAQNIGFAIPVDSALKVASDLLGVRRKTVLAAGLGVRDVADVRESPVVRSLAVERAEPGTPAATAGFRKGDVFVRINDERITNSIDLERALLDHNAGDKLSVTVRRPAEGTILTSTGSGSEVKVEVTLQPVEKLTIVSTDVVWRKLGIKLAFTPADAIIRANPQLRGGLSITDVNPEGAAAKAGIQKGDLLVGLHQWETLSLDNVQFVLNHPDLLSFSPLKFFIIRGGQVRRGHLPHLEP